MSVWNCNDTLIYLSFARFVLLFPVVLLLCFGLSLSPVYHGHALIGSE